MDESARLSLHIQGTIPRPGNVYTIPLTLDFHAVASSAESEEAFDALASTLGQRIKSKFGNRYHFRLTAAGSARSATSSLPTIQTKRMDWQPQAKELDEMFDNQCETQLSPLPSMEMPKQFADNVKLFDYQSLGIKWLVNQETANTSTPLFFKQVKEKGKKVSQERERERERERK